MWAATLPLSRYRLLEAFNGAVALSLLRSTAFSPFPFISTCCLLLLLFTFQLTGHICTFWRWKYPFLSIKLSLFISCYFNSRSIFYCCQWFSHSLYFSSTSRSLFDSGPWDQPGRFLSWVRPCMAGVWFTFLSFCAILFCWRGVLACPRAASSFP